MIGKISQLASIPVTPREVTSHLAAWPLRAPLAGTSTVDIRKKTKRPSLVSAAPVAVIFGCKAWPDCKRRL